MPDRRQEPSNPDRPTGAAPEGALLLRGGRLLDGRNVDVVVADGLVAAVGAAGSLDSPPDRAGSRIDLDGYLLLPAPVEPHAHLDAAFTAPLSFAGAPAAPDSAARGSAATSEGLGEVQSRVTEGALLQLGHGATAIRTHVRVGDGARPHLLEAVLAARRSLHGLTDLTAVAVPRLLTGAAGARGVAMLRDAVSMGASAVGGCPDLDPDPMSYTETMLGVAAERGCPVDLHTDGRDPALLARLTAVAGESRTPVTLGPCRGLGQMDAQDAVRVADRLAAAGVTVAVLPQNGCALAGGLASGRNASPSAPVALLRDAGVRLVAGSGALRDTHNPVGRGDPLEAAYLLAAQNAMSAHDAYEAVSGTARGSLGLPEVRLAPGFPAELLAVRGPDLAAALSLSYSRVVLHRGRVVARTSAVREFRDAETSGPAELPRQAKG